MNTLLLYVLCLFTGYLIGSILFADLITKIVANKNIRELGNGNPGAYNVFRNVDKFWGVVAGLLDAVKALFPMIIASHFFHLSDTALGFIGVGAVLGHGYPIFYHFDGGRAASTLMGMYLVFIPYEFIISFIIACIIVLTFIRKEYGIWGPTTIIALSAFLCLFFSHPVEVKVFIWIAGFITLFFNRDTLVMKIKEFYSNTGSPVHRTKL